MFLGILINWQTKELDGVLAVYLCYRVSDVGLSACLWEHQGLLSGILALWLSYQPIEAISLRPSRDFDMLRNL